MRDGVVIKERDDVPLSTGGTGVTGAGEPLRLLVLQHRHVWQAGQGPLEERGIVVDDEDGLGGWQALRAYRVDRGTDLVPPVFGVGADHHGNTADSQGGHL